MEIRKSILRLFIISTATESSQGKLFELHSIKNQPIVCFSLLYESSIIFSLVYALPPTITQQFIFGKVTIYSSVEHSSAAFFHQPTISREI